MIWKAEEIKRMRDNCGLSQEALSYLIGCNSQTLARAEATGKIKSGIIDRELDWLVEAYSYEPAAVQAAAIHWRIHPRRFLFSILNILEIGQ